MRVSESNLSPVVDEALAEMLRERLAAGKPCRLEVSGRSMGLSIPEGARVTVVAKELEGRGLRPMDVVLIKVQRGFLIHRLRRVGRGPGAGSGWRVCGDASFGDDAGVGEAEILGRVTCYEIGGRIHRLEGAKARVLDGARFLGSRALVRLRRRRRDLQGALLQAQRRSPVARAALEWPYRAALAAAVWRLKRLEGVRAVLVHRSLASRGWTPALSDIDLRVVLEDAPLPVLLRRLKPLWAEVRRLRGAIPLIDEVAVGTESQLRSFAKFAGTRSLETSSWRLLHGELPELEAYVDHPVKRQIDLLEEAANVHSFWCEALRDFVLARSAPATVLARMRKHWLDLRGLRMALEESGKPLRIPGRSEVEAETETEARDAEPLSAEREVTLWIERMLEELEEITGIALRRLPKGLRHLLPLPPRRELIRIQGKRFQVMPAVNGTGLFLSWEGKVSGAQVLLAARQLASEGAAGRSLLLGSQRAFAVVSRNIYWVGLRELEQARPGSELRKLLVAKWLCLTEGALVAATNPWNTIMLSTLGLQVAQARLLLVHGALATTMAEILTETRARDPRRANGLERMIRDARLELRPESKQEFNDRYLRQVARELSGLKKELLKRRSLTL